MSQKAIFLFKPWLPQFGFSIYGLFIEEWQDEPGYFLTLRSFLNSLKQFRINYKRVIGFTAQRNVHDFVAKRLYSGRFTEASQSIMPWRKEPIKNSAAIPVQCSSQLSNCASRVFNCDDRLAFIYSFLQFVPSKTRSYGVF